MKKFSFCQESGAMDKRIDSELLDSLFEYIILLNETLEVIYVNKAFSALFQDGNREFCHRNFDEIAQVFPSNEKHINESTFLEVKKHGAISFTSEVHDRNFNQKIIEFQISYLKSSRGFLIAGIDRSSVLAINNLITALPGSIYWKDKNSIYQGCNDFMVKTAGLNSRNDIIGKSDYELWPNLADGIRQNDLEVLAHGHPIETEEEVILPNNKKLFFAVVKSPWRDANGQIAGVIGNSIEITELKNTQAALQLAKEKAEAANKAKSEFIANMSHDIRTPLTGIIGISEILKKHIDEPEEKEQVQAIHECGAQLLKLLNSVLDVISSGNVQEEDIQEMPFSLKESIDRLYRLMLPTIKAKKILLKTVFDKKVPEYVIGDRVKIDRILLNLIGNAIKFTEKGYVEISVHLRSETSKKISIEFKISDTGIGVALEDQEKLFEPFFRVNPSYQGVYDGYGVGLYIVKKFVSLLGGNIRLESTVNKGTTFKIVLPLKVASSHDIETSLSLAETLTAKVPTALPTYTTETSNSDKKNLYHVLVVEDNPLAFKASQGVLKELACAVDSASDGKTALTMTQEKTYDLIFMDVGLPDMSGNEVAKHIRKQKKLNQHTPIVGLTAHAGTEIHNFTGAEMDEVLTKPLLFSTGQQMLDQFIGKKHSTSKKKATHSRSNKKTISTPLNTQNLAINEPLLDYQSALSVLGNEDITKQLIQELVAKSIPELRLAIQEAHADNDWQKVEQLTHKFKAGAVYCGVPYLETACQFAERYLKTGDNYLREELYQQLLEAMDKTETAAKRWLKSL